VSKWGERKGVTFLPILQVFLHLNTFETWYNYSAAPHRSQRSLVPLSWFLHFCFTLDMCFSQRGKAPNTKFSLKHSFSLYLHQIFTKWLRSFLYMFTKLIRRFLSLQIILSPQGTAPISLSVSESRFLCRLGSSAPNPSVSFCKGA
jgi:hypothetical protein